MDSEYKEIDLVEVFHSLIRHLPLILAVTILFGLVSWAYTHFFVTPMYTASSEMIAISNPERSQEIYTSAEHNAAVALVKTTGEVIKTNSILGEASERLSAQGLNYSVVQLKKMISVSSINETEVFKLIVTGKERSQVALIANTVSQVAEERIIQITEAGSVKLLEDAVTPNVPTSPHVLRNVALGALIGFVLVSLIVILRDLFDTTIWTEEQLTAQFKYPVLGLIPQLDEGGSEAKTRTKAEEA